MVRFISRVHRLLLLVYPCLCIFVIAFGLWGQAPRPSEDQNRLDALESTVVDTRLAVEHRLTALETDVGSLTWLVRASLGGIAGLLVEAALRRKARKENLS